MNRLKTVSILIAFHCLLPAMAQAHPGHVTTGFEAGFAHPIFGLDHVLAMFAVGLWAVQLGGRAVWCVPAAFVVTMLLGGALGMAHLSLPFVQPGILASILVLGILIACAARLPLALSVAIVGLFALFHGHAHGAEMPETAAGIAYGLGFAIATASLHGAGIGMALAIRHAARMQWVRYAGAAIAIIGAVLFLQ